MLAAHGVASGQSGAITVVQRVSSDLRLNPHYHALLLDGVFAEANNGTLCFHALPSLSSGDVAGVMQAICMRVLRFLARTGIIDDTRELAVLDAEFVEREPALAALASASVSGLAPAGPERRERAPLALGGKPVTRWRCWLLWTPTNSKLIDC
jgi:Putative transposase